MGRNLEIRNSAGRTATGGATRRQVIAGGASLAAALGLGGPALAQKAKDTLRLGVWQPIAIIDPLFDPQPQANLMDRVVFDTLLGFDAESRKIVPQLAESWKQVDPETYEFRLRKDVTFHNGQKFDADDVVYTVNFAIDPKVRFRFKGTRFGKFAGAEKVDQYTVRIKTRGPFAPFLNKLTTTLAIFPHDYHGKLADKSQFGKAPVGTGPYKAVQVDPTKGVVLVRNPDFHHGNAGQPAAKIGRIVIQTIPDQQTQIARMMVGDQDLMYDVTPDVAENLKANPDIVVETRPSISFLYANLDTANRSGIGVFKDRRVREAVFRAIDRKALVKAFQAPEIARLPLQQSMCNTAHVGCSSSIDPPAYDPAKAKDLLKQAGVGNFNLTITTWGPGRPVAEAVAGELRKVGINASVENLSLPGFVKKRAAGQLQMYIVLWDNGGGEPDIDSTAGFFFEKGDRNYNGDAELSKLALEAEEELDVKKREAMYRRIFDKATRECYAMPLIPLASSIAHGKDVVIVGKTMKPEGFTLNRLAWKG